MLPGPAHSQHAPRSVCTGSTDPEDKRDRERCPSLGRAAFAHGAAGVHHRLPTRQAPCFPESPRARAQVWTLSSWSPPSEGRRGAVWAGEGSWGPSQAGGWTGMQGTLGLGPEDIPIPCESPQPGVI